MRWLPGQQPTQVQQDINRDLRRRATAGTTDAASTTAPQPGTPVTQELWFRPDTSYNAFTHDNYVGRVYSFAGAGEHFLAATQGAGCLRLVGYLQTGAAGGALTVPLRLIGDAARVGAYPLTTGGTPGTRLEATGSGGKWTVNLPSAYTVYAIVIDSWRAATSSNPNCRLLVAEWTLPPGATLISRPQATFA